MNSMMSSSEDSPALQQVTGCVCFNLRKAARAVTQLYDEFLQASELRATQFTILAMLSTQDMTPMTRLAWELVMDRTTMTRNLKPLERQGLLTITAGTDRRTRLVSLTPQGRALVQQVLPLWQQAQYRMLMDLGVERWSTMLADLTAVVTLTRRV